MGVRYLPAARSRSILPALLRWKGFTFLLGSRESSGQATSMRTSMSVSPSLVIDMMWSRIVDWMEEGSSKVSSKGSGDIGVSGVRAASSAPGAGPRESCRESSSWVTSLGDSGRLAVCGSVVSSALRLGSASLRVIGCLGHLP